MLLVIEKAISILVVIDSRPCGRKDRGFEKVAGGPKKIM